MAAMITRLFKRVGSTVRSIRDNLADSSDSDVEAEAGPPEPSSMALPSDRGVSRLERFALLWEAPQVSEAELQSLCWLGIPDLYRAPCWQLLLGYAPLKASRREAMRQKKREEYAESVRTIYNATSRSDFEEGVITQIRKDVNRNQGDSPLFQLEATKLMLERILFVWAIRHPASSYVQGIHDLVTPLFLVFLKHYVREHSYLLARRAAEDGSTAEALADGPGSPAAASGLSTPSSSRKPSAASFAMTNAAGEAAAATAAAAAAVATSAGAGAGAAVPTGDVGAALRPVTPAGSAAATGEAAGAAANSAAAGAANSAAAGAANSAAAGAAISVAAGAGAGAATAPTAAVQPLSVNTPADGGASEAPAVPAVASTPRPSAEVSVSAAGALVSDPAALILDWTQLSLPEAVVRAVEADTYWCLTRLLDSLHLNYTQDQVGIQTMVHQMEEVLVRVDAPLLEFLRGKGVSLFVIVFRWMNCLLMREFGLLQILRLWDTYFSQKNWLQFHVYVCVALLTHFSKDVQRLEEFADIMLFLQALPLGSWGDAEIEALLKRALAWFEQYFVQ